MKSGFIYSSPHKGASIFELGNNCIDCILKSFWLHTDSFGISRCDHISISNSHLHLTIWEILENRIRIIRCLWENVFKNYLVAMKIGSNKRIKFILQTWYALLHSGTSHPLAWRIASTINMSERESPTVWFIISINSRRRLPFPLA